MALTDEQKAAAEDAYWQRFPIGRKPDSLEAYLAATERMQEENAKLREALQVGAAAMHGCGCNICANFYAHLDACGLNKAKEETRDGTD